MNISTLYVIRDPVDPRLHVKSASIKDTQSPETLLLADRLVQLFRSEPRCAGLALPQIGVNRRMFVADYNGNALVMCNPRIVETSFGNGADDNGVWWEEEGCISHPGVGVEVARAKVITVEFQLPGILKKEIAKAQGFISRVIQHEMDHLDGLLITDTQYRRNIMIRPKGQEELAAMTLARQTSGEEYDQPEI